jgi:hypothetical protein
MKECHRASSALWIYPTGRPWRDKGYCRVPGVCVQLKDKACSGQVWEAPSPEQLRQPLILHMRRVRTPEGRDLWAGPLHPIARMEAGYRIQGLEALCFHPFQPTHPCLGPRHVYSWTRCGRKPWIKGAKDVVKPSWLLGLNPFLFASRPALACHPWGWWLSLSNAFQIVLGAGWQLEPRMA